MRRLNHERGNVAIIVALMMTTLMGIGALVIDYGTLVTRDTSLQTGADAAALAIASRCAEHAVSPTATGCNETMAGSIAASYFNANAGSGVTVDRDLDISYAGRAGRITVSGSATEEPAFARLLGIAEPQPVSATATARWGPLTAEDAVFPLAICKGALPGPDEVEDELIVDPADTASPEQCDGAGDAKPMGWLTPDDPVACTTNVTLLPSTNLAIAPSNEPPSGVDCGSEIEELRYDLQESGCHTTPTEGYHCHGPGTPEDRTRVIAVYDAAVGISGSHPSYSLIAFEFTGARLDGWEATNGSPWTGSCDPGDPAYPDIDDLQCIRGYVRTFIPPEDGPILDPVLAALPIIEDTTVLDVRLVE